MSYKGDERRKEKRYGIRDSTVVVGRKSILSFFKESSKPYLVLNISKNGLHFISRTQLEPGDNLKLSIQAPKLTKTLTVKGSVVWVKPTSQEGAFRVGVTFQKVAGQNKDLLQQMIDSALLDKIDVTTHLYLKHLDRL